MRKKILVILLSIFWGIGIIHPVNVVAANVQATLNGVDGGYNLAQKFCEQASDTFRERGNTEHIFHGNDECVLIASNQEGYAIQVMFIADDPAFAYDNMGIMQLEIEGMEGLYQDNMYNIQQQMEKVVFYGAHEGSFYSEYMGRYYAWRKVSFHGHEAIMLYSAVPE